MQLAQKFIFNSLKLHAFFLEIADLPGDMLRRRIDLSSGKVPLFLNKIVLLGQSLCLLLADLLLTELCIIVGFLTHAVKVVLHHLFLSAYLFDCSKFLVPKIFITEQELLLFFVTPLAIRLTVSLFLLQALLLFATPHHYLVVVFVLQVLQFPCLLSGFINFLYCSDLFIL